MLTGVTIASLTVFAFLSRPTTWTCALRQWGFHLSVNLLYSPMFLKTLQVYRIFKGGKKGKTRQMFISSRWQRIFTSCLISTMVSLRPRKLVLFPISHINHGIKLKAKKISSISYVISTMVRPRKWILYNDMTISTSFSVRLYKLISIKRYYIFLTNCILV